MDVVDCKELTVKRRELVQQQKPAEKPETDDLIWITEAMVEYGHSRNWFNNRIATGELEAVQLPGTTKVYLRRSQLDAMPEETPHARRGRTPKKGKPS